MTKAGIATVLRVREIMSTSVVTIDAKCSVEEASGHLAGGRVSGAPVLDKNRIVGVVSKSDLIDRSVSVDTPVTDVMTRAVYAVHPEDPAMLAVQLMVDKEIHRALVVDATGYLMGVVTATDVLRAVRDGHALGMSADGHVDVRYVDLRSM